VPQAATAAVLSGLSRWHDASADTIRQTWLGRAHPIGTTLEIRSQQGTRTGSFAGLSPAGELLLRREDRIETISTGDVLLGLA
jgi:BirA family biotin operon repressor/biotin-[acetyl-CoA-carboxylase] ligase